MSTNKTTNTSKNLSLNLMGGRLGLYGKGVEIQYVSGDGIADKVEETISGLTNQNIESQIIPFSKACLRVYFLCNR